MVRRYWERWDMGRALTASPYDPSAAAAGRADTTPGAVSTCCWGTSGRLQFPWGYTFPSGDKGMLPCSERGLQRWELCHLQGCNFWSSERKQLLTIFWRNSMWVIDWFLLSGNLSTNFLWGKAKVSNTHFIIFKNIYIKLMTGRTRVPSLHVIYASKVQ